MSHNRTTPRNLLAWALRLLPVTLLFVTTATFGAEADMVAPVSDLPMGDVTVDPNVAQIEGDVIRFIAFQKDRDITDGLRLLAQLCKKNIVPSKAVTGPLTVSRLYDVTFEEALQSVLGYGFRYDIDGDFVRVYTTAEYRAIKADPERMVHKVITLYYITSDEANKLIQPVLSQNGGVQFTSSAEKGVSGGEGSVSGGGGGNEIAGNDTIVVFDFPEKIEAAEQILAEVDIRPQQVLIEAAIMSATLSEENQFGIDWNLLSGVSVSSYPISLTGGSGTPWQASGFADPGSSGLSIGFSADNVQAIVTALETVADTTLLANPKVLSVNKQEGIVYIGRKIGYISQQTQNETGSTSSAVEFLETGTRLAFRPFIGVDGYIRMDIYPKDSTGTLKENDIPDETTTELRANVIVKDGETIVIGGLFRDSITTSKSQVPVLGNLPLLGSLFRGTNDIVERQEVIVVLTPHIIYEPSELLGDQRVDDIRRKMGGAKSGVQPFSRTRLAEDSYTRAARFYLEGDVESAMYHVKVALMIRPSYLEARRLYERIIAEIDPEELKQIDSIVEQAIDQQEANNWQRY